MKGINASILYVRIYEKKYTLPNTFFISSSPVDGFSIILTGTNMGVNALVNILTFFDDSCESV